MPRLDRPTLLLTAAVGCALALATYLLAFRGGGDAREARAWEQLVAARDIPFNGQRAYDHLRRLCELGPRPSGSAAMRAQQELLIQHFQNLGARVTTQTFEVRHPEQGTPVPIANLVIEFHPERTERILLCAHYDTRPYPDRDRRQPRGPFLGANDGASGTALLMELGNLAPQLHPRLGIDFVLFDGEEFVWDDERDQDYYFLGSTHFARLYQGSPPAHRYRCGVLLDMVADARLELYQEKNSLLYARSVVTEIWNTARRLGVAEFHRQARHELRDDHIPLNEIAKIPTCDLIDFDYPSPGARSSYWHTTADTPDKCSAVSLGKVGWVLVEWIKSLPL